MGRGGYVVPPPPRPARCLFVCRLRVALLKSRGKKGTRKKHSDTVVDGLVNDIWSSVPGARVLIPGGGVGTHDRIRLDFV